MVAGKVKAAMGLQKSSPAATPKHETPKLSSPSSAKSISNLQKGSNFSRSFGVYFPRASAQVQPRPPDVTELLRLVEELRERESRLKTELLEQKLIKESVAILPVLENEILNKEAEIEKAVNRIVELEVANEMLRRDFEVENEKLRREIEVQRRESEARVREMEEEIARLRTAAFRREENEELTLSQRFQGLIDVSVKSNLIRNLKNKSVKPSTTTTEVPNQTPQEVLKIEISNNTSADSKRDDIESGHSRCDSEEIAEISTRSRAPRVPKPPPKPSSSTSTSPTSSSCSDEKVPKSNAPIPPPPPPIKSAPKPPPSLKSTPPPPPPPPLVKGSKLVATRVRRVPEVVEFYHSLMRRDSRKDSATGGPDTPVTSNPRDMIGEIENRSAHLLAIKTDVETQGDFIRFLIKEIDTAAFTDIEDVVPFVKWLDDELSYLVDERAVLKHFQWPEKKADGLREAAFGYCDLKKLETEALSFRDDARQPCTHALKKMQALFEKLEHGLYNLSRMRESSAKRYKLLKIPMDWMLETGIVNQIKHASVKLALNYMKRVSAQLETVDGGPEEEELIVQGVRFAFRVHQFAGGFDVETMKAFQELRDKAKSCHIQCQSQPQKLVCRSTPC